MFVSGIFTILIAAIMLVLDYLRPADMNKFFGTLSEIHSPYDDEVGSSIHLLLFLYYLFNHLYKSERTLRTYESHISPHNMIERESNKSLYLAFFA